jgi:hypothetical protein
MKALTEALSLAESTGERNTEPWLYQLKGGLQCVSGKASDLEVEQSFRTAIRIAQSQCSKSRELAASTRLARLLRGTDRRDEARAMLAEIYNWFSEGFDTADLKDAKALLDELSV